MSGTLRKISENSRFYSHKTTFIWGITDDWETMSIYDS